MKKTYFLWLAAVFFGSLNHSMAQSCQEKHLPDNLRAAGAGAMSTMASNLRSDTIDILNYNISLNITDFTTNVIKGNTAVKFVPKMNGITQLRLDLLELIIDSIEIGGANLTSSYNDTLLNVNLPSTLNIGDTATVVVHYHGTPQGDASGWGGFYFSGGYAFNLGVGFASIPHVYGRVWFPCFDNFVERSTYEFNITTNAGKTSYCNGYLANDTTDVGGNRTRRWVMNTLIPTYLACVAVANYAEINQSYAGIAGTYPIVIAAVASDTTAVKSSFINLPVALSTFEDHFGPYMWNKVGYSMVPFSSGAMEHATNIAYPKVTATGSLTYQNLWAHELAHHWFGDLATCRTAEDMWLNEGWAHYCEFLFFEELNDYASYLSYVRSNHESNLQFNLPKEGNLTLSDIPQTFTYGDHVYNKGADVAHTLRGYMGDSLFFYSVKTYLANNNFKDVSSTDFMNELSAASGMNLADFFNGWVFNPGWPHFSIDSSSIVPSGLNYDVTVYFKQKLTGAPAYFNNVPLEITFKAADWTENTQSFMMSGASGSHTFTVPFSPAMVAMNMGEKISHAVAPDFKTIKTTGAKSFANAKFTVNVSSIVDSAFIRVEHNYTAPDPAYVIPYRISPNHYWKVDGILPSTFSAKGSFAYDGRTTGFTANYWLDNDLIDTFEDSLFVLYRPNVSTNWSLYPYQTRNIQANNNDKRGIMTIDSLQLGEYVLGRADYAMGIQSAGSASKKTLKVFPNPAKGQLTIDLLHSGVKFTENTLLVVTDVSGKIIHKEKVNQQQLLTLNTATYADGMYFVTLNTSEGSLLTNRFVVAH